MRSGRPLRNQIFWIRGPGDQPDATSEFAVPAAENYELPENSTSIYKFVGELTNAEVVMEYK